jgi:hypothetical protein
MVSTRIYPISSPGLGTFKAFLMTLENMTVMGNKNGTHHSLLYANNKLSATVQTP